eukprot:TRINITY_DN5710_c0_g1_i3.p1 TRINITY_DN5710_c0_g1~~TRINITY_DN5710_c0_g1_i3.p1  ORF type:complete len:152 (+),score=16.88 TRINITY_DN5710_c0_g1_i3:50-505(+)
MAIPQGKADSDVGLKLDIIAAASIGPCKKQHRATMVDPNAEGDYWDCVQEFSSEFMPRWGSREKNGFTYYFERGGSSQWERPAGLQKIIQDGLATARKGTDYSPARPWETCELLNIAHYMCLTRRQGRCENTQRQYMNCRQSRKGNSSSAF